MDRLLNKVAGVVVLYNPAENVSENIKSYINQVDHLFIVDNSINKNSYLLDSIGVNDKISYIFNNANLGVATALNIGAQKAIEKEYDYLLTMDQDSKAPPQMVERLLETALALDSKNIGLITPYHSNKYGAYRKSDDSIQKVKIAMTSGNLLSLEVYSKIGGFNEDYFIDYIDIEYCFRLNLNNYSIFRVNDVVLEHNEANITQKKFLNRTYHPFNHQPFRLYYKTRNLLYLRKKYKSVAKDLLKKEYREYLIVIGKIILFEKQKLKKIRMIFNGFGDYLIGKKGKRF